MLIQMVSINVKGEYAAEFLEAFRINYEGTSREPGNLRFDVLRNPDDDHSFIIYEVFKSSEALKEHRKARVLYSILRLIFNKIIASDKYRLIAPLDARTLA